jgi:ATP-dependent Clp protease ATP-binding subunit ClpC
MEFIAWHYSEGLSNYLRRWYYLMAWVVNYFSLPLLLPTLFYPWKRLIDDEVTVGFSFERAFRRFTFNVISRCIGAIVRIFLLIFGLLAFFPCFLVGLIGLMFWICIPVVGIPYFITSDTRHHRLFTRLISKFNSSPDTAFRTLITSQPGKFILAHLGPNSSVLSAVFTPQALNFQNLSSFTLTEIINRFISSGCWDESQLQKLGINFQDLLFAAQWWDEVYGPQNDTEDESIKLGRPGLGLELLFGYTPLLNQLSVDLSLPQEFSPHLMGRSDLVNRMERELSGGNSIILVGSPGVGKKTVVLEFAKKAMEGELGPKLIYKRVLDFDYNFLLSESLDINQKKAKFSTVLSEAAGAGNIILVIKDLHRLTHSDVEGVDFTDVFEKHLEAKKLKLIAISSPVDYERFIVSNSRLRKYLQPVEIPPASKSEAMLILFDFAFAAEKTHHLIFSIQALRTILDGSDKYITDTPFPEKALELFDHLIVYLEKNNLIYASPDEVNAVLAEQTGISLSRLTQREKQLLGNLEEIMHQNLVGQDSAVSLISKSLRARTVGVKNENRPVGSFLFLGPTGVGKTQAAKTLAQVYYGSEKYLLRYDMAEFAGPEGLTRLIGSANKNQPGVLTTAIKNKPASLLLLDEIEKAPPEVYNLFLSLLDEGQITDAFGKKIIARHLFIIATSNAAAVKIRELVAADIVGDDLQSQVVNYIQSQGLFTPEFLNRFDGVVVFQPLTETELVKIAKIQLRDLVSSLKTQNITLEITEELAKKVAHDGFEPEFGARSMRRVIDLILGDVLGKAILNGDASSGDHIRIIPDPERNAYHIQKML